MTMESTNMTHSFGARGVCVEYSLPLGQTALTGSGGQDVIRDTYDVWGRSLRCTG